MFKVLYGKDKKDGYKVWMVSAKDGVITITHGKLDGKLQEKTEVISGKNIGKANETTPEQQAVLEAESRYKKQLDKGYRPTLDELEDLPLMAMLAVDYHKKGHLLEFPCLASVKLDGNRCLAIRHKDYVELRTRGGKTMEIPHIQEALLEAMHEGEVLDGEIYKHGYFLEEIVSAIRTPTNPLHKELEFWAFDVVTEDVPFKERYELLCNMFSEARLSLACIRRVIHEEVFDEDHMKRLHKRAVEDKFEGIMCRNMNGIYESGKRSSNLLKYKTFFDDEFKIVGVVEDRNGNAVLVCYDHVANANFNVCYGDFEERKRQLEHPEQYVGKWLTVKYQTRYKDSGLCQFPTGVCIRTCTEDGTPTE